MNAIQLLSAQPWVERLGTTLVHFLWEGLFVVGAYAAARRWARAARPNVRYVLACVALAALAAAPILTWNLLQSSGSQPVADSFRAPRLAATSLPAGNAPSPFAVDLPGALPTPVLSWVVAFWLAGAVFFWLRLLGGWVFTQRLRAVWVRPAPLEWQANLERLKCCLGVSRPVRLLVSSLVKAPAVVGWLRPVILMPLGALAGLPPEQIEALLLHELAHIRRHDYLVNLLQSCVEALLFYHPAVWWISGHLRLERELCCDDLAVSATGDVLAYARALSGLEPAGPSRLLDAVAANGGSLSHRIARLLGQSRPAPATVSGPGIVAAAILLAIPAAALLAQNAARLEFEVASVKPSTTQNLRMVRPLPGGLTADAPLSMLIQNAYSIQAFQIAGAPAWIDSNRYAIDAKSHSAATREQIFQMLQTLLEDRFQLRYHRETRDLPVYALVAAKNGFKLPPPKDGGCENPTPDAPPAWAGGRMQPPGGPIPLAPCGSIRISLAMAGAQMQGGKIAMPELVRSLSMALGKTVIDKTGFAGLFDVHLVFLPDEVTPAMPPPPPDAAASSPDPRSPSILVALQEQLGLRIENAKGPVQVLVVDHVQQPSAN